MLRSPPIWARILSPAAFDPMRLVSLPEIRVRVSLAVTLLELLVMLVPFCCSLPFCRLANRPPVVRSMPALQPEFLLVLLICCRFWADRRLMFYITQTTRHYHRPLCLSVKKFPKVAGCRLMEHSHIARITCCFAFSIHRMLFYARWSCFDAYVLTQIIVKSFCMEDIYITIWRC